MLKRYLMLLSMLLALPGFANAWYVNAKTSPATGQGMISPSGNTAYAAGVNSGEYTVTPAAGYKIGRVTLDGVQIAANGNGKYVAPYVASKAWRYIVAYFTANTVNITTSVPGGNGAIREDTNESLTNIPVGSARQLLIIPNPGYTVDTVDAAGAVITGDSTGQTAVYSNLQANQAVSATFALIPVVTASAGNDVTTTGNAAAYAATLYGSATSNQGAINYAWTGTSLVFGDSAAASTTVYSTTPGVYTATLTVTSGSEVRTDTATVTVVDRTAYLVGICAACHNNNNPVIMTQWTNGAHGTATGHTTGTCQRCHATEGAIAGAAAGWTGSYTNVLVPYSSTIWRNNKPAASSNAVTCTVCHDTHNGLRQANTMVGGVKVAWDPNQNSANDQFDVCTSCHAIYDNTGAVTDMYHEKSSINTTRIIADSHYDNPATGVGLATNTVEGYVIRKTSANPCADCHNVHSADLTVQEAWAKSAHSGKIATKKDEAACTASIDWFNATYSPTPPVTACTESKTVSGSTRTVLEFFQRNSAGVAFYKTVGAKDDADGNAWTHYNWDQTTSRGSCQRCHTATGIANFLTNPAAYDATGNGNDFSHLSGWTKATGSPQNELLYCWGCHSDAQSGVLRNPGAITEVYAGSPTATDSVTVSYPDVNKSNVCMACHLGRETGAVVKASTGNFANLSFINSHYLAAGATIFNQSGYEYDGQSYDSLGYHKNVGVADVYNTGTAGPCVTCHMTGAEGHSFDVVSKDANGAITAVASAQCANCHGGLTPAALTASEHEFHLAMEELKTALANKGIYFYPAHPYFYKDPNGNGFDPNTEAVSANAFKNWDGVYPGKGKDVMGAAFNYNLLEHDPGAYAHNRQYALKLISDSIDFLADGIVDGQGVSAAFTAAATNKEFAETTSHPAPIVAAADSTSCATCHQAAPHYGGAYNGGNAQFVANNASCADCHANGVTTANGAILAQYAESGHGNVAGAPWKTSSSHDWPNANTCRNCHSTTGFTATVGGIARTTVVAGAGQTLACDACHSDLSTGGAVRPVGQVTVTYKSRTFSVASSVWRVAAPAVFPSGAAQNNICITCHAGRESGESILALTDASMSNTSFKNPHYLGAAGMMYAKLAFIDFADRDTPTGSTSTISYGLSVTANEDGGKLTSTHRKLGTAAINGDSHNPTFFVPGNLDSDGPCATCHMGDVKDHTWEINDNAVINVCNKCHSAEFTDVAGLELFLEEQAVPFNNAVDLAIATLKTKFNISYTEAYPYFYDDSLTPVAAAKDWTRSGALSAADAKKLMGACLNIKLMKADPAAYVHSRTYARRVLYDTIDWLDNKIIDMSVIATAVAWDPIKYVVGTDANPPSTESVLYLKGYNRTSKAWNTLERP